MMATWYELNRRHLATAHYAKGEERRRRRLAEEEMRESSERSLQAYGEPLETIISLKYLGRVLTAGDDNWPEVAGKLRKARKIWTKMTRILGQEGKKPSILRLLFKAVVLAVLLFW